MPLISSSNTLVQSLQDDIEDLHKLLVLKAMTQYVPHDYHKAATSKTHGRLPHDEYRTWRRYLDKLSFLCDFDSGGGTVAGLVAQAAADGTVFWLATNCSNLRVRTTMKSHLRFVLRELDKPYDTVDELAAVICARSIELSGDKVKSYGSRLEKELQLLAAEEPPAAASTERTSLETITELAQAATGDPGRLCSVAAEIVLSRNHGTLNQLSSTCGSRYLNVRHFLCRLCSWHMAARYLARYSKRFCKQIGGARIELLPIDLFDAPQTITLPPDTEGVLRWILGSQKQHFLPTLKAKLVFTGGFLKRYGGRVIGTVVHAEAALAEFAYARGIEFVFDDRYIGCSKPSCYACSMYLSNHPGNFIRRPSHGNAWFKWYPPRLRNQPDGRGASKLLREMAVDMQADLDESLIGSDLGKRQPFESTSGIGTTIRRIHETLTLNGGP